MAALTNRDEFEAKFAQRLARLASRHRRELESLLGNPPNIANVPESFWQKVEQENEELAAATMLLIFLASADEHGGGVSGDVADAWISDRSRLFAQSWTQTSRNRLETAYQRWQAKIDQAGTDGAATDGSELSPSMPSSRLSAKEIEQDLLSIFGPDRVAGAAVTETTAAESGGGESAIRVKAVPFVAVWRHGEHRPARHSRARVQPCPICSDIENMTRDEWEHIHPNLYAPPAHPHCDCYLEYVDPTTLEPIPLGRTSPGISQPVASRI